MYSITPSPLTPTRPAGLRLQLLIACGLLSVIVAIVSVGALEGIAHIRVSAHQAVAVDGQLSRLASEVTTQTLESRRYEKDFFLNVADPRARADYLAKWQTTSTALDQAIAAFAANAATAEDKQQAARWRQQVSHYIQDFEQIARAVTDGHITTSQAANTAFLPSKENIRALTESSVAFADNEAALAVRTSTTLEASGTRTSWLVGLLAALALTVTVGYGAVNTVSFRRFCTDCGAWLPLSQWFGGEHRCRGCDLRRLARLIDEAETRERSE